MPKLQQPEPLPRDGKLSSQAVRDEYIAYEGLGYCVFEYIPAERLADPELQGLWKVAQEAMRDIVGYLETVGETRRPRKLRRTAVVQPTTVDSRVGDAVFGEDVTELE